jgi:hypothetical protein
MKKILSLCIVSLCLVWTVHAGPKDSKTHYAEEALRPYVESGRLAAECDALEGLGSVRGMGVGEGARVVLPCR